MSLPLKGIKVLDFTHLLPGEQCSTLISDLGAEVIRIEPLVPGFGKKLPPVVKGESLFYWSIHRNKCHFGLNLKDPEGIRIVEKLVEQYDVLIENFRPGVMKRLGLGYKQLRKINPNLIYCSISGYGQESLWASKPGHDLNFIAESGILDLTARNGDRPVLPGALIADNLSAIYGALAITSALLQRKNKGRGKHIDISMFEAAFATQSIMATALKYTGTSQLQANFRYPSELPNYSVYECKDGRFIAVASLEPQFWQTFCKQTGLLEFAQRVITGPDPVVSNAISSTIKQRTLAEWMAVFSQADCCVSPVNRVEEALEQLPVKERHALVYSEHPVLGRIPQIATPSLGIDERKSLEAASAGNVLDTSHLLKKLGYNKRQIKKLAQQGVIH